MAFAGLGALADGFIAGGDAGERWKSEGQRREFAKKDQEYQDYRRGLERKELDFQEANRAAIAPGTPTQDATFSQSGVPGAGLASILNPQAAVAPGGHDQVVTQAVNTPAVQGTPLYGDDNQKDGNHAPGLAMAGAPKSQAQIGAVDQGIQANPVPNGPATSAPMNATPTPNSPATSAPINVGPGLGSVPTPGAAPSAAGPMSTAPAIPPPQNVPVTDKQITLPPQTQQAPQQSQPITVANSPLMKPRPGTNYDEIRLNDLNARIAHARANGRADYAAQLIDSSAPLRDKVRATAMNEADNIYRASGDPRPLMIAYNQNVHDGGNVLDIRPDPGGYKVTYSSGDGHTATKVLSKEDFNKFRNSMIDAAGMRAAEAKHAEELRQHQFKMDESKAAPFAAKPDEPVWVDGRLVQQGTLNPQHNYLTTPEGSSATYIGPGQQNGATVQGGSDREFPKAAVAESEKAAAMARSRFGGDPLGGFAPDVQTHIANQQSYASRVVLANHGTGNQMSAAEASQIAEQIDTGKLKEQEFEKNGVKVSGVMLNGRVVFTNPAQAPLVRQAADQPLIKSGTGLRPSQNPTPAGFPKVTPKQQAVKDSDRLLIYADEISRETARLQDTQAKLAKTTAPADRESLMQEIERSQGNLKSLQREVDRASGPGLRTVARQ